MTRILVVDDNCQNRYMLEAGLKGIGYEVTSAENGAAALALARKEPPDLAISDILMPVMDGYELCRQWKADDRLKEIPFIFYTATYTDPRDERFGLRLGADRYIIKPAEIGVLQGAVRDVLEEKRRRGGSPSSTPPQKEEETLREYNEVVARKLQRKVTQLEESEARFRSLVEGAPEAIFVQGGGRFLYLNPAMVRLMGARGPEELVAPEEHAVIRSRPEGGPPTSPMEQEYLRCDGSRILVETTAVPLRYAGIAAQLVFVRDITERKRMEAELLQAQKMESVGRLAGGLAHDFNNLLTAIQVSADFVMKGLPEDDPNLEYLKEILAAGDRAASLTRQLLAFSRKQLLRPMPLDLNEIVTSTAAMLKRLLGEDVKLETRLAREACAVKVDVGQIDNVLMNLAVNARDAMPKGGSLTISTEVAVMPDAFFKDKPVLKPGPLVVLSVSDTGCGMTDEVRAHAFEPFFTTKETGKGTGLGLATVYGAIRQSGGAIELDSAPGRGTTFRMYFPKTDAAPKPKPAAKTIEARGETVLLVEDEPVIRRLAERTLADRGYEVLTAADGPEALRALKHRGKPVDLVVTDLVLPGMSGREMARDISRRKLSSRTLYISGYAGDAVVRHGALEPGLAFLEKPFSPESLLCRLREVLDGPTEDAHA
ncbi:MAG: response regulator [Elusimicrobiota bacterium]